MDFDIVAGLIFMCVLGPAVGNYACSVVYRLPRSQTPFEKKPYCGHCGTMLKPIDLFPLVSFILTRGKCRYCGDPIRSSYFVIELLCLAVFIINFLSLGMTDSFLLLTAFTVFLIILVFIDYHEGFLSNFILTLAFTTVGLLRVLQTGSIYPWIQGGFTALFVAAILWQISRQGKGTLNEVPHWVWLTGLIGASLAPVYVTVALGLSVIFYAIQRVASNWKSPSPAMCIALYVTLVASAQAISRMAIPL